MKITLRYLTMALMLAAMTFAVATTTGCKSTDQSRSTGQYIDDKAITSRVKSALFADPNVSGFQVDVDTFDGVVQLNGFVDTPTQKGRAEEIARTVPGVREVKNNLSIREVQQPGT